MKRFFILLFSVIFLLSFTSCSNETKKLNTNPEQQLNQSQNTQLKQNIQTDLYQISIPKEWTAEKLDGNMFAFKKENKKIGGLDIIGYYPEQPISQLEPNHSEVIESKTLEGFFTEVMKEKLKITPPAASGETTVTEQVHLFFIIKEKKIAYDLYFNTADVDEQTALNIAKSLKLK